MVDKTNREQVRLPQLPDDYTYSELVIAGPGVVVQITPNGSDEWQAVSEFVGGYTRTQEYPTLREAVIGTGKALVAWQARQARKAEVERAAQESLALFGEQQRTPTPRLASSETE